MRFLSKKIDVFAVAQCKSRETGGHPCQTTTKPGTDHMSHTFPRAMRCVDAMRWSQVARLQLLGHYARAGGAGFWAKTAVFGPKWAVKICFADKSPPRRRSIPNACVIVLRPRPQCDCTGRTRVRAVCADIVFLRSAMQAVDAFFDVFDG